MEIATSLNHDLISNKLVKLIKSVFIKPATLIINQMLSTGIFPEAMKLSKVIPLFKNNDTKDLANYRPISLSTSSSKLFEKVIYK